MKKALQTIGLEMENEDILTFLLPKTNLNVLTQEYRSKILALRKIIEKYNKFIPSKDVIQIKSPEAIVKNMYPFVKGLEHEELWILTLDIRNSIIGRSKITSGGFNSTVFHIKMIIKKCLDDNATGLVIIHNHPAGNPTPGKYDIAATRDLKKACKCCDIEFIDHVIISDSLFFSFAQEFVKPISKTIIRQ